MKFIIRKEQLNVLLSENNNDISNRVFTKLEGFKNDLVKEIKSVWDVISRLKEKKRESEKGKSGYQYYQEGLRSIEALRRHNIISDSEYRDFVRYLEAKSKSLLFNDEGKWDYLNKLNTNYTALAKILTDILIEYNNNPKYSTKIGNLIQDILDADSLNYNNIGHKLNELFDFYFSNDKLDSLYQYSGYIEKTSDRGSRSEDHVTSFLQSKGYEIIDKTGDGNYVDMVYSIDMVVKSPKGRVFTIQIKSSESQLNYFIDGKKSNPSLRKYKYVDIVLIPYGNSVKGYNFKNNTWIQLKSD